MNIERTYCPTCAEYALDTGDSKCAWCDGALARPQAKRKHKWHADAKMTEAQVRLAYDAYLKSGLSVRQIAGHIWDKAGYASACSCANTLDRYFRTLGLPLRSRTAVTVKRNFKHGKATREARANGGDGSYRRWYKAEHDRYQPICKGVKAQSPRKGTPCTRPAQEGSDYCFGHDPARAAERESHLAAMRARSPMFRRGSSPAARLTPEQVAQVKAESATPVRELAERYGVTRHAIHAIRRGQNWAHIQPAQVAA